MKSIIIVESKYSTAGRGALSTTSKGPQMGDEWIRDNIRKMKEYKASPAVKETGELLEKYSHLIERRANVMDGAGANRWNKITLPTTSEFKG